MDSAGVAGLGKLVSGYAILHKGSEKGCLRKASTKCGRRHVLSGEVYKAAGRVNAKALR